MNQLKRFRILLAGVSALGLAVIVEVGGMFYANGFLQHNIFGFSGGILAVLGIIAISVGRVPRNPDRK